MIQHFLTFIKEKIKNINILHECKKIKKCWFFIKSFIEDNINEDNKDATINHPLYDDELESTIKKTHS
jgi:hypothetical protein